MMPYLYLIFIQWIFRLMLLHNIPAADQVCFLLVSHQSCVLSTFPQVTFLSGSCKVQFILSVCSLVALYTLYGHLFIHTHTFINTYSLFILRIPLWSFSIHTRYKTWHLMSKTRLFSICNFFLYRLDLSDWIKSLSTGDGRHHNADLKAQSSLAESVYVGLLNCSACTILPKCFCGTF